MIAPRKSTLMSELDYVVALARKETDSIGFLPLPRLKAYAASGQIYISHENEEPCGFLVFGNGWPFLRIYQACIQYDTRRREHGAALVARLEASAISRGYEAISLWCAEDLEANTFWNELGFLNAGVKPGGKRRGRILNRWEKRLSAPIQPSLDLVRA